MARTVFCKKLGKEAEGLDAAPLFGKIGKEIFENISGEAWAEWEEMQLKIVNEYHLDLAEKADRNRLREQMLVFLRLKEGDLATVGMPPDGSGS